jgi:hypothetical protein
MHNINIKTIFFSNKNTNKENEAKMFIRMHFLTR